ncbi:prolyl-tRNA synthetase associated domain-containing protein [Pararhizobium haloflavum]|uniref:prolyl-tRNA synthetase associated domain-containing protein n=1 Tax=Pararhizobium haloflavum TaxID=2037914 RepID=UPI000C17D76B|nr:YbaK/EbsC family protein [Pararhizobium haloflavum]
MHQTIDDRAESLFQRLDALGIAHRTVRHESVYTVEEAQSIRDDVAGAHTKNLFVKDKKDNYFLLVLEETAQVDLKTIHGVIGARSRVSFANAERLMEYLGVEPGSVTSLAAINDTDLKVTVILDEALMDNEIINAHPLKNDATTSLSRDDLVRFLRDCGHEPLILKLSA